MHMKLQLQYDLDEGAAQELEKIPDDDHLFYERRKNLHDGIETENTAFD